MAYIEAYKLASGTKKYRTVWRSPEGQKQSKSFGRKRDAETLKVDLERREQLGTLYVEAAVTFGEFVGLGWDGKGIVVDETSEASWVSRYRPSVRPGSYRRRKETFRYLADFLPLTFDRITPALVEDAVSKVAGDHPRQGQYLLQTIKMILRAAARRGQPVREAVLQIKPPSYEARRKRFLTKPQVDQLAQVSGVGSVTDPITKEWRKLGPNLIRFAALTGLRFVEIAGLTDEDVALGDKAVLIHRGITKTDAGARRVPLGEEARGILKAQRESRGGGSGAVGSTPQYLFPAPQGGAMSYSNFYHRLWVPTRIAFGMADLDFHDLRHTYAALMIAADAHPRVLKDLMGHESIKVTMDTYGHLYEGAGEAAVEALDIYLSRDTENNPPNLQSTQQDTPAVG